MCTNIGTSIEHVLFCTCLFVRQELFYISKEATVVLYSFSLIYNMCFSKSPGTEIGSIVFSP